MKEAFLEEIGGVAPSDRPGGPRSLESAPDTARVPQTPTFAKMCCGFLWKMGGVAPRTDSGGPGSLESASLGPVAPSTQKAPAPGICQPGAPDTPGGTPQTP